MKYLSTNPKNKKTIFGAPPTKKQNPELQYLKDWLKSQHQAWSKVKDNTPSGNRYSRLNKHIAKGRVFELEDVLKKIEEILNERS